MVVRRRPQIKIVPEAKPAAAEVKPAPEVVQLPLQQELGQQTTAFYLWRANAVEQWLRQQQSSELTRACLRGIFPNLDPVVADRIFSTVLEQLAANVRTEAQHVAAQHGRAEGGPAA